MNTTEVIIKNKTNYNIYLYHIERLIKRHSIFVGTNVYGRVGLVGSKDLNNIS